MNEPHAIKLKKLFVKTSGDFLIETLAIAAQCGRRSHLIPVYVVSLFRAYFCFATGKQSPDIAMMASPDKAAQQ